MYTCERLEYRLGYIKWKWTNVVRALTDASLEYILRRVYMYIVRVEELHLLYIITGAAAAAPPFPRVPVAPYIFHVFVLQIFNI